MSTIYLVRHGQASFHAEDYDHLSALGVEQATAVGRALAPRVPTVDVVVTGAMRRHRDTARHALAAMPHAPAPTEDADWNEYAHDAVLAAHEPLYKDRAKWLGSLGPDPASAMRAMFAAAIERWMEGAHDDYPESFRAFHDRTAAALARLVARLGRGQTALVFTSGGPISLLAGQLLGVPEPARLYLGGSLLNASITKLVSGKAGPRLATLNDHAHFEGAASHLRTYV